MRILTGAALKESIDNNPTLTVYECVRLTERQLRKGLIGVDITYTQFSLPENLELVAKRLGVTFEDLWNIKEGDMRFFLNQLPYSSIDDLSFKDAEESSVYIDQESDKNPYVLIYNNNKWFYKLLNLLQYGLSKQTVDRGQSHVSYHTRLIHSIDVAFYAELIGRLNGLSDRDIIKLVLVGMLHDIATPAFGDATKKGLKGLHEETEFLGYMQRQCPKLCQQIESMFGIAIEELADYVKNRKVIGKILDMADRIAYTARDVENAVNNSLSINSIYLVNIKSILYHDDKFADIVFSMKIEDDTIIFEDSERLVRFLEIRANMHNLIYLNPHLRTREYYVGLVLRFLVDTGHYTKEGLQAAQTETGSIGSKDLSSFYQQHIIPFRPDGEEDFFTFIECEDEKEVRDKLPGIVKANQGKPVFVMKIPAFTGGTDWLVRDGNEIKPLHKVGDHYRDVQRIQELSKNTERWCILYPHEGRRDDNNPLYEKFRQFALEDSKKNLAQYGIPRTS